MSGKQVPADAPPSYQDATGASSSSSRPTHNRGNSSRLSVSNSVPDAVRRSMEDEHRPLPKGWVRTFDPESQHQFFVDTRQDPPRSIWHHPYDDEEYLRTLSSDERERIEQESMGRGKQPSHADIMASHTDDEEDEHAHASSSSSHHHDAAELPPRPDGKGKGKVSFGRKLKDKITGTTAEQREAERKRRAEEERRMYEQHRRVREAMTKAMETGQPQLVGKDKNGKDVFVDPPNTTAGPAGFGTNSPGSGYSGGYYGGYGGGYGGYGGYGPGMYSPYRYARPYGPYGRPYGGGFGGGYGLPLALGGGLMGGLLLGDALAGGF